MTTNYRNFKAVWLKFRRAQEHFNALDEAIKVFLESDPYSFWTQPDPSPPNYAICAKANRIPPIEWSAVIGDFSHNARSALDHIIQAISDLEPTAGGRRRLQFPIFDTENGYRDRENRYLRGVSETNRAIVEGFQPYKRASDVTGDALGLLGELNNADKHRLIHIVGALPRFGGITFTSPTNLGPNVRVSGNVTFGGSGAIRAQGFSYEAVGNGNIGKHPTIVARLIVTNPMQMQPNVAPNIQFGESDPRVQGRPVVDTLTFIRDRVEEVIREFDTE